MLIELLGTGTAKCEALEHNVIEAASRLRIDYQIKRIEDLSEITARGVMVTPSLVVNDKVVIWGRVASVEHVEQILRRELE